MYFKSLSGICDTQVLENVKHGLHLRLPRSADRLKQTGNCTIRPRVLIALLFAHGPHNAGFERFRFQNKPNSYLLQMWIIWFSPFSRFWFCSSGSSPSVPTPSFAFGAAMTSGTTSSCPTPGRTKSSTRYCLCLVSFLLHCTCILKWKRQKTYLISCYRLRSPSAHSPWLCRWAPLSSFPSQPYQTRWV